MPFIDTFNPGKKYTVLLAHGAGADANTEFMQWIKQSLDEKGVQVIRFNFPYMEKILREGKRRPPDRMPVLLESFTQAIESLTSKNIWIGGKSMGGRVATLLSDHPQVLGTIALGYPFHPPGKPDNLRTEHLEAMKKICVILQGERDPFGKLEEVSQYKLSKLVKVHWLTDGEHSFKPRKASGVTQMENIEEVAKIIEKYIKS